MQVKLFTRILKPKFSFWMKPLEKLDCGLETDINHWLASNPSIDVISIKQSQSGGSWIPSTVVVSVWYQINTDD
ncbi:hypothetical protein TUM4445_33330 [Shewanella sp. MBTL60-112-B2]|nr:hypothetical protein TUM4444_30310 [Shewanella sp. MBTL60-112-B1]GIU38730.1 hypothetical protein TUM4445_33330 [Shewanella sp. MBTL60-112-B2]